ncbi:hypothetical protein MN116_000706 [Schistosoma mekongi]|uniref:Major facilitator superfamily (MFS) profile domain-containing protein n=1 Tax=Schistosoma mekongi TaxID=38744 RepID=A0AAE1ZI40_SCHME|nr:hypothetical protein MN116_000706 [Schistosoma mekongi]
MSNMHKIYPWFILITAALCVIFLGGKRRAFGIFVAKLHSEFNQTSLAELNWIGDSYAALGYLSTTLTTSIIISTGRRFNLSQFIGASFVLLACISSAFVPNPHWLFLSHTLFHGIGSSLVLSTCGLVVNEHFDKNHRYHILATTLVSGGSVASIVFVELYALLIDYHGWRSAFIILGFIYFVILLLGSLIFHNDVTKSNTYQNNKISGCSRLEMCWQQKLLLILWTVDRIITSIVTYGMLLNLADYMYQHESLLRNSVLLTNLFAAGEATTYLIGATLTAITKDFLKNRLKYILISTSIGMSIGLITWEYVTFNHTISAILSYLTGFCLGPSVTFLFPAGEEMTLLPGHIAYPFSLGGMGAGMALSPLLSAFIAQTFKYRWFFLVQGVIVILKCMCLTCSWIILKNLTKSQIITVETGVLESSYNNNNNNNFESINYDSNINYEDNQSSIVCSTVNNEKQYLISPITQKHPMYKVI